MKMGKDAIASLLAPAKDIVAILDAVAQIHPAVQVRNSLDQGVYLNQHHRSQSELSKYETHD